MSELLGGSSQTTTVELPEELQDAAVENLELAKQVSRIPYAPYFGPQVAAFSPMQEASFAGTNSAASAFGLPSGGSAGYLPEPTNVGGYKGYSTQPLYEDALSNMNPDVRRMIESFFSVGGSGGQTSAPSGGGSPSGYHGGGGNGIDALARSMKMESV